MPAFNFQVDRQHKVLNDLRCYSNAELSGEAFTVPAGSTLVYRGLVELDGTPRYAFDWAAEAEGATRKAYSKDRTLLESGLQEDYDALMKA